MADWDDITLGAGFNDQEESISAEEWFEIVYARIDGLRTAPHEYFDTVAGISKAGAVRRDMIRKLAQAIPAELRTREIAQYGDIRALTQKIVAAPNNAEAKTVGGIEFTAEERIAAGYMNVDLGQQWNTEYSDGMSFQAQQVAMDSEQLDETKMLADEAATEYRYGQMNKMYWGGELVRNPTTGEVTATQDSTASNALLDMLGPGFLEDGAADDGKLPTQFLSQDDYQRMIQQGEVTLDQLLEIGRVGGTEVININDYGQAEQQIVRGPNARVLYTDDEVDRTRLPNQMPGGQAGKNIDPMSGQDWYSLNQILSKPAEMRRDEAMKIHNQLKDAGIYALIGDEPIIPGDPADPAFKAAWKRLAGLAIETGKSMTALLDERKRDYAAELMAQAGTALTDPARLRLSADAYARQTLGRKLNHEEQRELVAFMHELERRNATVRAGLDGESPDGVELDEGIIADIDAQMQEYIERENPVEAGAHSTADQFANFETLLRGPGRGI